MSRNSFEIQMPVNNIGRFARIEVGSQSMVGSVLDLVSGTNSPKRIRIQHGDVSRMGTVVQPHEYRFLWWCDEEED
jgi:hypothetical protein